MHAQWAYVNVSGMYILYYYYCCYYYYCYCYYYYLLLLLLLYIIFYYILLYYIILYYFIYIMIIHTYIYICIYRTIEPLILHIFFSSDGQSSDDLMPNPLIHGRCGVFSPKSVRVKWKMVVFSIGNFDGFQVQDCNLENWWKLDGADMMTEISPIWRAFQYWKHLETMVLSPFEESPISTRNIISISNTSFFTARNGTARKRQWSYASLAQIGQDLHHLRYRLGVSWCKNLFGFSKKTGYRK